MTVLFSCIAMVAITNTTLVSVVTQSRILYGMAKEGVVPSVFARVQTKRRSPWVALAFSALLVVALLLAGKVVSELGVTVDVVARLATVTVVFVLLIYSLVIVSTLKLRGSDEADDTFHAPTPLLVLGLVGNLVLLAYVVQDDPTSLWWCGGLLAVGVVLFALEYFFGQDRRATRTA
jgi:amino acid transporter